ncbi:MAG: sdpR 2 [Cyanobacteria bacterium RYN_339]|nr:sdpR 2 [Cyanobacteria bacterium RYN_339]
MTTAPDEVFRALADPTRRAIFQRLVREGEQTVRSLTDFAGVSQPAVSKHLALLKVAGLVHDRPSGRQVHYRADPQGLAPLVDWMSQYNAFWQGRLDRLEDLLERMEP